MVNQITFYAYSDQVFASRQFTLMFPTADFLQDQTWGAKSNITVPSIEVSFPFNFQQNSSPPSDTKGKQDKDEEELHMYDCPLYRTSLSRQLPHVRWSHNELCHGCESAVCSASGLLDYSWRSSTLSTGRVMRLLKLLYKFVVK